MKRVASALVLCATIADLAVPALVAPALILAASTAARAEPAPAARQAVVTYRDLNLAAPSGMATFKVRAKIAAEDVCGPQADLRSVNEAADYKGCVAKAIRDAVSALPRVQQQASQPVQAG